MKSDAATEQCEEEEIEELYREALGQIEAAAREREEKFPKIEALRRYWETEVCDQIEGPKDADWIRIAIRIFTRDIEDLLDPDAEDPIDDPGEWLEYAYQEEDRDG